MNMNDIEISTTQDYDSLVKLFIQNDLEFSVNDDVPTDLVKLWKAEVSSHLDGNEQALIAKDDKEGKHLIGGCVLALREGEYIIDGIAIDPKYRKEKLGQRLLTLAIEEVKARGGKWLFLVARAPEFFRKQDFITIERQEAPTFFECFTCPQYKETCFPEVMKLKID